ncbi:hypothetical protein BaRGS_00008391, partial [Batillaria attramentaria]
PVDHQCIRPCVSGQTMECQYNFTVEWYRTLTKACYQCPFNVSDCYRPHCVAAGGNIRALLTINRQMPGPAIQVCEGDTVVVAVTNMLEDGLSTSIHWHGQHMHGTPYMDGMGQVTQYKFKADPAGSHWYHAHTGMQSADGLFGALIVRQPPNYDPNDNLYDLDLPEHVIIVNDWLSELSMARYVTMMHKIYELTQPTATCWSTGRGRNYNVTGSDGAHAQTPLDVLHVQKGKKYRMRLISTAPACPMQVSVDDHQLMVISVDGMPLQPRLVDTVIVHPGERYDFVLDASEDAGNYWLRVLGLYYCDFQPVRRTGAAILRYEGAPEVDPSGDRTQQRDGILLNPILFDGNITKYGWNREVIRTDDMRYAYDSNYTDEITFRLPPVPILSQPEDVRSEWFCNHSTIPDHDYCQTEDVCMCTHMIRVKLNQIVELVVFHAGRILDEAGHNVHLHGHKFRLLGLDKVGKSLSRSNLEQMDARGELRRNYIKPPVRDTVNVPDGGYAIIRFTATNPGFWMFHCHMNLHLQMGMALLIQVGDYSDLPPVPDEFPRCGGMGFSNARRRPVTEQKCATDSSATLTFMPLLFINALLVTFLLS